MVLWNNLFIFNLFLPMIGFWQRHQDLHHRLYTSRGEVAGGELNPCSGRGSGCGPAADTRGLFCSKPPQWHTCSTCQVDTLTRGWSCIEVKPWGKLSHIGCHVMTCFVHLTGVVENLVLLSTVFLSRRNVKYVHESFLVWLSAHFRPALVRDIMTFPSDKGDDFCYLFRINRQRWKLLISECFVYT